MTRSTLPPTQVTRLPAAFVAAPDVNPIGTDSLQIGAKTDPGLLRSENQDRMTAVRTSAGHVFIVADGLGGHQDGGLAAEIVVERIEGYLRNAQADEPLEPLLRKAFEAANRAVYERAKQGDSERPSMGSTAVVAVVVRGLLHIAHVGDSRAYLYRAGKLLRLTRDHTLVAKMVQEGVLSEREAEQHPESHVLERALGIHPSVEAELRLPLILKDGDGILLCTDGLCGYATDPEITAVLGRTTTAQAIADQLVELSLKKGGADNATVQFVHCARVAHSSMAQVVAAPLRRRKRLEWRSVASFGSAVVLGLSLVWGVSSLRSVTPVQPPPEPSPFLEPGPASSNWLVIRSASEDGRLSDAQQTRAVALIRTLKNLKLSAVVWELQAERSESERKPASSSQKDVLEVPLSFTQKSSAEYERLARDLGPSGRIQLQHYEPDGFWSYRASDRLWTTDKPDPLRHVLVLKLMADAPGGVTQEPRSPGSSEGDGRGRPTNPAEPRGDISASAKDRGTTSSTSARGHDLPPGSNAAPRPPVRTP